jgi:hypothetical protein
MTSTVNSVFEDKTAAELENNELIRQYGVNSEYRIEGDTYEGD